MFSRHSAIGRQKMHVTGYLFGEFDPTYQPPIELEMFLDSGKPSVCVSFGSMLNRDAQKIDHIVNESLIQTNHRGIILSGWSEVKRESLNSILYLDSSPHQWLLPHCKMIIHPGGAGPKPAPVKKLSVENLTQAIFDANDPLLRKHAQEIGQRLRSEDGVGQAIEEIEKYSNRFMIDL